MKLATLSILSLITLIGCTNVKPPIAGRGEQYGERQVHFADQDLADHMVYQAPRPVRDQNGILHVDLPVRADTNYTLRIDYRVRFMDRNGQVLNQTNWIDKTLYPNVFDTIKVNSTGPEAVDFTIDLRYAR